MLRSFWFKDANPTTANSVLLAGSGRSGTTWLAELMNHRNRYRYMFEPFARRKVGACRQFNVRQYLRPEDPGEDYLASAEKVLSGQIRSRWVDSHNRRFNCHERMIKETRGNLMLGWLHARFPEMKIVMLMRHPGAVVNSRIRLGWDARLDEVLSQQDLIADHMEPFLTGDTAPRDAFERHVFLWCMEQIVPLRQFEPGAIHTILYEHLFSDPEAQLRGLSAFLGHEFDPAILKRIKRPSKLADRGSNVRKGHDVLGRWRSRLTDAQSDRLQVILRGFGLDTIYTEEAMPHTTAPLGLF